MNDRPLDENAFDFESGQIPTFRVRIEGRLLDDEDDDEEADSDSDNESASEKKPATAPKPVRKFSSFFKSIVVELDRENKLYPEGNLIEWRRPPPIPPQQPGAPMMQPPPVVEFDGFEFERKGDLDVLCTIKLERNETQIGRAHV